MKQITDFKTAELKFFHAYVRRALIGWCAQGLANGDGSFDAAPPGPLPLDWDPEKELRDAMVEYARSKNWVSKTERRVLVNGYKTATGMMKVL